jgi:1D-myo-inositol 3-kinase
VAKQENIELVAVGHVTIDRVGDETRLGGAVSYAALTARHLGLSACMVTSAGPDFPFWDRFEGIYIRAVDSEHTTELEHHFVDGERHQRVHHLATAIGEGDVAGLPLADDAAVLYCPVVHEIETPLVAIAPRGLCGVAPQGFFRQWDESGRITVGEWHGAKDSLVGADVVCMSETDAEVPEELAETFAGRAFVITKGGDGCRVYAGADVFDFPALPARIVDTTGAGDVLATAFLIALRSGKSLPDAVRFASREAATCVESVGVEGLL